MDLPDSALRHLRGALERPETIAGRYDVAEELGRGGMGAVYRAYDRELDRDVAVKILTRAELDPRAKERLQREARIAARLEHPGIVPVYDVGLLDDGRPFYVMKLVAGVRLDAVIASELATDERVDVFLRICDAAAYAHARGVVHRDIKPENVRVGAFGEVQVLDFGVAKVLTAADEPGGVSTSDAKHATRAGAVVGTLGWMAPEQARGENDVDARADVHALGRLFAELLARDAKLSRRRIDAIAAKASAARREDRYARVEEFAADVRALLAGEAVSALPEGPLDKLWRVAQRHQTAIAIVLAYLALRILFVFYGRS